MILLLASVVLLAGGRGAGATAISIHDFSYPVGENPKGVRAGDCNGDGVVDLIVANQNSNDTTTLRGTGDGRFEFSNTNNVATQPTSAVCADFNGDTLIDVAALSRDGNSVTIYRRKAQGGFTTLGKVVVGFQPRAIALAELNGDGNPDLLITNFRSHDLTVLLGTGTDAMPSATTLRLPIENPVDLAVADFNLDGKPDIAVAGGQHPPLAILLGNGGQFFSLGPDPLPATTRQPPRARGVASADLDGDGLPDLALLSSDSTVYFYLGTGTGQFVFHDLILVQPRASGLVLADLNGDPWPDLALTYEDTNTVQVLLATGPADFPSVKTFPVSETLNSVAACAPRTILTDPLDPLSAGSHLLALSAKTRTIDVIRASGRGLPAVAPLAALSERPERLLLTDLTGDGIADAVVTARTRRGVGLLVLVGNATGGFDPAPATASACGNGIAEGVELCDDGNVLSRDGCSATCTPEIGRRLGFVATADLDLDGRQDLVVVDGRVTVVLLFGDGTGRFREVRALARTRRHMAVSVADFTGDGAPDIVMVPKRRQDGGLVLLVNDGAANFTTTPLPITQRPSGILLATDLDHDGAADLLVGVRGGWLALYSDGTGPTRSSGVFPTVKSPTALSVADVDEDGWLDVVTFVATSGRQAPATALLHRGSAPGAFAAAQALALPGRVVDGFVLDLDGDRHQDIVSCGETEPRDRIFYGDGTGVFGSSAPDPTVQGSSRGVSLDLVTDMDGDGTTDLIGIRNPGDRIEIAFRNANLTVATVLELATGRDPISVALADLDVDGRLDVVTTNHDSNDLSVFLNRGNRQFSTLRLETGGDPVGSAIGDLDLDGLPDIVTANRVSNNLSVFTNEGGGVFSSTLDRMRLPDAGRVPTTIALADLDHDGRLDAVIGKTGGTTAPADNVTIVPNRPGLGLALDLTRVFATGTGLREVMLLDLNGDSEIDLLTRNRDANSLSVLLADGAGGYVRTDVPSGGLRPSRVVASDLDGDTDLDLVVLNEKIVENAKIGNLVTLMNDGLGTFGAPVTTYVRGRETPRDACVADLDGDERLDVALASFDTQDVTVLRGRGDGSFFRDERSYPVREKINVVRCTDIDGDGDIDLLFGRRHSGRVGIIRNEE